MALKGRHWAAVWLLAFLAVAWIVIARQTSAIRAARELTALHEERANLAGHAADLDRRMRAATSRTVLLRRARARLGLRLPADTEIILLPVPDGERR
jgi:cell division protein FtsB